MTDIWYTLPEHVELWKRDKYCLLVDRKLMDVRVLHPSEAVVLSLLDGEIDFNELTFLISYVYRLPQADARFLIDAVFKKTESLLAFSNKPRKGVRRYDPKTFIFRGIDEQPGHKEPLETPLSMTLVLTRRCNFKCRYCYFGADRQPSHDLRNDVALNLVREAGEIGIALVNLAGGEPLMYPDICDLISAITEEGMITSMSTNGSLLDEEMVLSLLDAGLTSIQVSLDCPTAGTHHFLTQTKNTFASVLSGIQALSSHGTRVRTRSVITAHNWKQVGRLIDLLVELGVDGIELSPELSGSCDAKSTRSLDELTEMQIAHVQQTVKEKTRQYTSQSIAFRNAESPWQGMRDIIRCGNLFSSFVVHPTGEVNVCEMIHDVPELSYGNVYESYIKDIWLGPAHGQLLGKTMNPSIIDGSCSRCEHLVYCRAGCFNLSQVLKRDSFAEDPRCPGPQQMSSQ